MLTCQNCGQVNHQATNFCRFCGTKITVPYQHNYRQPGYNPPPPQSAPQNYEQQPPRPYSWKTDEYQIDNDRQPRQKQMDGPRPLAQMPPPPNQPAPMQAYVQNHAIGDYHCPRCSTTLLPRVERKISTAGWIVFAALLITFFPLFWIGFLIKEDTRTCPVCRFRMS